MGAPSGYCACSDRVLSPKAGGYFGKLGNKLLPLVMFRFMELNGRLNWFASVDRSHLVRYLLDFSGHALHNCSFVLHVNLRAAGLASFTQFHFQILHSSFFSHGAIRLLHTVYHSPGFDLFPCPSEFMNRDVGQ